ncbi:MAG: DUF3667 domain-containing protein [Alistipes sp.]|nr:DUF3667 domain-containing protein [Alistipes sp.]
MSKDIQHSTSENGQGNIPYKYCLNCGSELKGMYCHVCGQQATSKTPTVGEFVREYLNNAFIWDPQFFKTLWTLIRRPGHLTNEYLSGKFVSQEHPLKLNMFLLFVFITLFVFFSGTEKMHSSVHDLTNDERVRNVVQIEILMGNPEFAEKIKNSPRDTVLLRAPLVLAERYSGIMSNVQTIEDSEGEAIDKWVAVLPRVLIEDKIVVPDSDDCYHFDTETGKEMNDLEIFNSVWREMVNIIANYFPMLVLFTAPFLSMSLIFVQRKSKLPRIHHFIFALHYTAFLEFLMMCIYVLFLTVVPNMAVLKYVMVTGSCVYLTVAFRNVYGTNTWMKAVIKALFTSAVYLFIGLAIFLGIFIAACFVIAGEM